MKSDMTHYEFDELCRKLARSYVIFLNSLNEMNSKNDEFLSGGLKHSDCKNHFLSNAYLSKYDKFDISKPWTYHSKAAGKQIKQKGKDWNKDLRFEHIVPKQKYLQDECEKAVIAEGLKAEKTVCDLLKKYWKIAVITSEENSRLYVHKMPDGWKDGDCIFERYNKTKDGAKKIILFDYNDKPMN